MISRPVPSPVVEAVEGANGAGDSERGVLERGPGRCGRGAPQISQVWIDG